MAKNKERLIEITEKIQALISSDTELKGFNSDIPDYIKELNRNGKVKIGYRNSCGVTDDTLKSYRLWIKTSKLIIKQGFAFEIEHLRCEQRWATRAGGFWQDEIWNLKDDFKKQIEKEKCEDE